MIDKEKLIEYMRRKYNLHEKSFYDKKYPEENRNRYKEYAQCIESLITLIEKGNFDVKELSCPHCEEKQ
jgi:hypothetical protein